LAIVIAINLPVAITKLVFGQVTGTVSIFADGLESFLDFPSELMGLIALVFAARPADSGHPYGHRKAETLATLIPGALLLVGGGFVVREAMGSLTGGVAPRITNVSFGIMVASLVLESGLAWLTGWQGKRLNSDFLKADSAQLRNDQLRTAGVLAGLVAASFGFYWIDPALGFTIAAIMIFTGAKVIWGGSKILMDAAAADSRTIEEVALSVQGVQDCHAVRTRGRPDDVFVDLHVLVDPDLTVEKGHEISENVVAQVRSTMPEIADVMVHLEPHEEATVPESGQKRGEDDVLG
jgi:cation diffusion facilitator family transporter